MDLQLRFGGLAGSCAPDSRCERGRGATNWRRLCRTQVANARARKISSARALLRRHAAARGRRTHAFTTRLHSPCAAGTCQWSLCWRGSTRPAAVYQARVSSVVAHVLMSLRSAGLRSMHGERGHVYIWGPCRALCVRKTRTVFLLIFLNYDVTSYHA